MRKKIWLICTLVAVLCAGCGKQEKMEMEEPVREQQEEAGKKEPETPQMPKDLRTFQFSLNGRIHALPENLNVWEQAGWKYQGNRERILQGEEFLEKEILKKNGTELVVDLVNTKKEEQKLKDCKVGMIRLSSRDADLDCRFPNGILLNQSGADDVIEAYGAPSDEFEEKGKVYLTYEFGIYQKADFVFREEDKILTEVVLKNYREPLEIQEEADRQIPPEIAAYKAPEALTDDLSEFVVNYGNNFYRLPAPVSEFLKNGWKISPECQDDVVKSGHHGYVTLERKGQTLYAVVRNYAEKTAVLENCFILNVHGDFNITRVPVETGKGIALGISEEQVEESLKDLTFEKRDNEYGTSYYVYPGESKDDYLRIFVDGELGLVREIEMSNGTRK